MKAFASLNKAGVSFQRYSLLQNTYFHHNTEYLRIVYGSLFVNNFT